LLVLFRAIIFWSLCCAPAWAAQEVAPKRFALPGQGFLELQAPASWLAIVRQPTNQTPPTIVLGPMQGLQFEISLTPSWPMKADESASAEKAIRERVERLAEDIKPNVVERNLDIVKLKGSSGTGFYFSATDKSPKPMEYKFVTQGIVNAARITVGFTILTHEGQGDVVAAALAMLKTAKHIPPAR